MMVRINRWITWPERPAIISYGKCVVLLVHNLKKLLSTAILPCLVYFAPPDYASAQDQFEIITGPFGRSNIKVNAVSADGKRVGGTFKDDQYRDQAFTYDEDSGFRSLTSDYGGEVRDLIRVNDVAVGLNILNPLENGISYDFAQWRGGSFSHGALNPCTLRNWISSEINAISADGSITVGGEMIQYGPDECRWRPLLGNATGLTEELPLPFPESPDAGSAVDVSANGSVIVGSATEPIEYNGMTHWLGRGVIWQGSAISLLADFWGVQEVNGVVVMGSAAAQKISADGRVIGGTASSAYDGTLGECFSWTSSTGMTSIGPAPTGRLCWVTGISDDGSTFVGYSHAYNSNAVEEGSAFVWTKARGMRTLTGIFSEYGLEKWWQLRSFRPTGISDDGTTIVGIAKDSRTDQTVSWIARLRGATYVDPINTLLDGDSITRDPERLSNNGREIYGVAADGAARAIIRAYGFRTGRIVSATILDSAGNPSSDSDAYGQISDYQADLFATTTTSTTVVNTTAGSRALFQYRAPKDFYLDGMDPTDTERIVKIKLVDDQNISIDISILIVAPPVFLVHGTFSSPEVWDDYVEFLENQSLTAFRLAYDGDLSSYATTLTTEPSYTFAFAPAIKRNTVGVEFNAPFLLDDANKMLSRFRDGTESSNGWPVAAVKGDFIAHSLGGLMVRGMRLVPAFFNRDNFDQGIINRLITLGATHRGTHQAIRMLNGSSNCSRDLGRLSGAYNFLMLLIDGKLYGGAVGDQRGDGTTVYSSILKKLENGTPRLPDGREPPPLLLAPISAEMTSVNFSNVVNAKGIVARLICGANDEIARNYSNVTWNRTFDGLPNDVIVPVSSAQFGLPNAIHLSGVVHGIGSVGWSLDSLGFNGPHLLEQSSGSPEIVVSLLRSRQRDGQFNPIR